MALFKRGNIWWYKFQFGGQTIRESAHTKSESLARKAERKRHTELEESTNGITRQRTRAKKFSVAAREWMAANEARWSESNVAIQEYNLDHLTRYFGNFLLSDITAERIGKYQSARRAESYGEGERKRRTSVRTVNMEVQTMRMILKSNKLWAHIADDVKMLPERKKVGKALEKDEVTRLLNACLNSPSPSLHTAVVIFANTALRNAELRKACWGQVDFLREEFQVGAAKTAGSEGRVIPLNKAALEAFTAWKVRYPDAGLDDYIFPSEKLVYKGKGSVDRRAMTSYVQDKDKKKPLGSWKTAWRSAKAEAKVEARIHDLRHHVITILAESQTPISTIKSISGHLSPRMVEHYSHIRDEARRKAMDVLDAANRGTVQ